VEGEKLRVVGCKLQALHGYACSVWLEHLLRYPAALEIHL